jgi:chaperonin cofactor prefoldin
MPSFPASTFAKRASQRQLELLIVGCATLLAFLALAYAGPAAAQAYKWVDDKGVIHYTDTPPPDVTKRQSTQINSQGRTTRINAAALTPEQLAEQQARNAAKLENEKKIAERKRLDNMLTSTYSKEPDFDAAYNRSAASINAKLASLSERMKAVDEREAKINDEMEFYKAGKKKGKNKQVEVPAELTNGLERATKEREVLKSDTAIAQKELAELKSRIDFERARWKALKGGLPPGTLDDASASSAVAAGKADNVKR